MVKLFDSHCHLHGLEFQEDMDAVLRRAGAAGVRAAMLVGFNVKSSERAVSLAKSRNGFFASVGIHPHDAKSSNASAVAVLKNLAKEEKVRAYGEIGLDFNRMFSPQAVQEKWFARQLEIVDELDLPVILHERDSKGRFLEILKQHRQSGGCGVVHCFSGTQKEMFAYLDLGYCIGITGIITIEARGADLRELVPQIPAERLLVETDAPFLTPAPHKNKVRRNEPAFVRSVLIKLAEVRGEDPKVLSAIIWENTCRLYRVDPNREKLMETG
ncbi:MAG: TatD family hydrolase [Desulfobacterales bacterium]